MNRNRWAWLAGLTLCFIVVWFGGSRHVAVRLLAKEEHVRVLAGTGQWYHWYTLRLGRSDGNAVRDTFIVAASRDQFDGMSVGTPLQVGFFAPIGSFAWIADSASAIRTVSHIIASQFRSYNAPRAISPLLVPTPGLARVVSITNIERRPAFWDRARKPAGVPSTWLQVIEVEFWAPRIRGLVHAVDVIDAGSIPGLHPGDVLQMHFDARNSRTLRLDDGTRTYNATP